MENSRLPCYHYYRILWVLYPVPIRHYICSIAFHIYGKLDMLRCIVCLILLLSRNCCQFSPSCYHEIYFHCSCSQGKSIWRSKNSKDIFLDKHEAAIVTGHYCVAHNKFSDSVSFKKLLWKNRSSSSDSERFFITQYEFPYLRKPKTIRL